MNIHYLLPHRFKKIGWYLFLPSVVLGLFTLVLNLEFSFLDVTMPALIDGGPFSNDVYFGWTETNAQDEILSVLIILSGLFVAFSREKDEDEFIAKLRLESLVWATYINYAILLVAILFLFNFAFFYALIVNMFTILLFFIGCFHWKLYAVRKGYRNEE